MNSKRFFVFAILLYCNLFLSSCSSDLNFDQINDFSAEPEIVGNLAYFELPIPSQYLRYLHFHFQPLMQNSIY